MADARRLSTADESHVRTTCYVGRNAVKCCITGRIRCGFTTDPKQIEDTELEGYSWPTCSKQPRPRVYRSRYSQPPRPSTIFADNTRPVWARGRCRISPPRFLAECCKRQLNQGSFVLLYFRLFTFLYFIIFYLSLLYFISDLYWVSLSAFSCTVLFVSISQVIEMTYTVSSGALNSTPTIQHVDHTIDLLWQNFISSEFGTKFQREVLLFCRYPNFLITQSGIGGTMHPCQNQLDLLSSFDTAPACDRRTDKRRDGQPQDDSIYCARIASRSKNS